MSTTACFKCGRPSDGRYCPVHRGVAQAAVKATWRPGRGTKADRDLTQAVLERDQYMCHICGKGPATGDEPADVKDHDPIPYVKGGPTTLENLKAAHRICNARKGAS